MYIRIIVRRISNNYEVLLKENKKSAFTIAELILTTVIMAVVCVIAPMVILKRDVKPAVAKKFDFIVKCRNKCVYDAHTSTMIDTSGSSTNNYASLDYNKNSNEFYTIELIGGGGGGSQNNVGYPGESKTVYLPSLDENIGVTNSDNDKTDADREKYGGKLTGYYLMEVGAAGAKNASGSPSVLCVISKELGKAVSEGKKKADDISCSEDGILKIASAQGGITSNQGSSSIESSKPKIRYLSTHEGDAERYCGREIEV